MKKYELTTDSINRYGRTLFRIKALIDFDDVKSGDLGGFVENEGNLSHEGNAWIYDDAKVFDNAKIYEDAKVYNTAEIYINAEIYSHAEVHDIAKVYADAKVYGRAKICDHAMISGYARVYGDACILGNTRIYGCAEVYSPVIVYGNNIICDFTDTSDGGHIYFGNLSKHPSRLYFKRRYDHIHVSTGFYNVSLSEFEDRVRKCYDNISFGDELLSCIEDAKIYFKNKSGDVI